MCKDIIAFQTWRLNQKSIQSIIDTLYTCLDIFRIGVCSGSYNFGRHEHTSLKTGSSPRCPLRSHSLVCIENRLFLVGIGPILNKELEFNYRSDRSDRTYVYSQVSEYSFTINFRYKNVKQSVLFFVYKNMTQNVKIFVYKNITESALFFAYKI